jgi:hypothetical protein
MEILAIVCSAAGHKNINAATIFKIFASVLSKLYTIVEVRSFDGMAARVVDPNPKEFLSFGRIRIRKSSDSHTDSDTVVK